MTDKNVLLKDQVGNNLYPKTKAELVTTTSGGNLGTVEVGAQVNKLEKVQLNGVDIAITNKTANVVLPDEIVYSVVKSDTAEDGYSATYHLTKDGVNVGASINIPKDMVVESGSVKEVTEADKPVTGYKVGDKYIDLILANSGSSHIYILVTDLIDVYTAGNGIKVDGQVISIDTSVTATQSDVAKKQNNLTTEQLAAVNSGITATKVTTYDGYSATINLKANASDVYTKSEIDGMNLITYSELA
jgi:hypothetical protein